MASVIRKLHEFRAEDQEMSAYIDSVELYFQVNEIDEEKLAVALLTAVGGKTYSLLRNLVAPQLPKEKYIAQLNNILKAHFEPKPLMIAERFRLHQRSQQEIESVKEYVAELKRMAKHCNFRTYLNEALRDRLVCGLRNKKRLLSEAELTFERAFQIAQGMESAERICLELPGTEEERLIKLRRSSTLKGPRKPQRTSIKCFRCGENSQKSNYCLFKVSHCFKCRNVGHIAGGGGVKRKRQQRNQPRINVVGEIHFDAQIGYSRKFNQLTERKMNRNSRCIIWIMLRLRQWWFSRCLTENLWRWSWIRELSCQSFPKRR